MVTKYNSMRPLDKLIIAQSVQGLYHQVTIKIPYNWLGNKEMLSAKYFRYETRSIVSSNIYAGSAYHGHPIWSVADMPGDATIVTEMSKNANWLYIECLVYLTSSHNTQLCSSTTNSTVLYMNHIYNQDQSIIIPIIRQARLMAQ